MWSVAEKNILERSTYSIVSVVEPSGLFLASTNFIIRSVMT